MRGSKRDVPGSAARTRDETSRSAAQLLRDRAMGPYILGKVLSSCGVWVQNLAGAILMFDLTRSAFMVGTITMAQFAGPLVLALWAGAVTDRVDRRKLLIAGRLLSGSVIGMLAVVMAVRGTDDFGGPPVLMGAMLLVGIGRAFSSPAQQALLPALVPAKDLEGGLALNSIAPSIARTVGPALGAALLLVGGPTLAFAAAGLSHVTFAVILLTLVRVSPRPKPRVRPDLFGGLRYLVRDDPKAGRLMLAVALLGCGADPSITLSPSLAEDLGTYGETTVGLLVTAFGIGAVLMTVTLHRIRRVLSLRRSSVLGFLLLGGGMMLAGVGPNVETVALGYAMGGFGFMMGTVVLNTRIQSRVPEDLRGRVMGLWAVAFSGTRPFAAVANGLIADATTVRIALLLAGALTMASSLLARVSYGAPTEAEAATSLRST